MKLSRFTLALCLAASVGLSVPARQAQCQGGLDTAKLSAEKSGSPSYQAAQSYDEYDCFYAGCHADYGDSIPELPADESNVRLEGLPPEPALSDLDLPGDEPTCRDIPAVTATPASSPYEGFVRGDQAPQVTPPRGYFSPGYPHPGYIHPNYGYSHTEANGAWFPSAGDEAEGELTEQIVTQQAAAEEALLQQAIAPALDAQSRASIEASLRAALLEEGFEAEAWMAEASAADFDATIWMRQAAAELFDAEAWMAAASAELFDAEIWMAQAEAELFDAAEWMRAASIEAFDATAWMNEAVGEDFDAEIWMAAASDEVPLASDETLEEQPVEYGEEEDLTQVYTRYDDTYGFNSEWYGAYDATQIDATPYDTYGTVPVPTPPADYTISGDAPEIGDAAAEVDPAPSFDDEDEAIVDYGPAELEIDLEAAESPSMDEEDAAFEAAIRQEHDDWFYRETYGYGPRYDYDLYGYEEFLRATPDARDHSSELAATDPEVEQTFPWEYLYRLELGIVDADASTESTPIPLAPRKSAVNSAEEYDLAANSGGGEEPTVPASSDFDPSALISGMSEYTNGITGAQVLSEAARLSKTITPMELAKRALAAIPVAERPHITILIPQPKEIHIATADESIDANDALRELALLLDDAGRALQSLSRRMEALADRTSPASVNRSGAPLQSRQPASVETR